MIDPQIPMRLGEEVDQLRAENARLREELARIPRNTIERLLNDAMDKAVANGANSVSMPDEYVELAAWLCNIPPDQSFLQLLAAAQLDAARYNELLMSVQSKWPNETRHETALRYIRERETPKNNSAMKEVGHE